MESDRLPPVVAEGTSGDTSGGQGGPVRHPSPHDDARLEAKALRYGWAVPEKYKQALVNRQIEHALSKNPRDSTRAFVALRAGDPEFLAASKTSVSQSVNVNTGPTVIQLVPEIVDTHAEATAALARSESVSSVEG